MNHFKYRLSSITSSLREREREWNIGGFNPSFAFSAGDHLVGASDQDVVLRVAASVHDNEFPWRHKIPVRNLVVPCRALKMMGRTEDSVTKVTDGP